MKARQRGLSLITVLAVLLLTLVTVLDTFRTAQLNEILQGNSSDQLRAYTAAESLIRDAEIDIRERQPGGTGTNPWFPRTNAQFAEVRQLVHTASNSDPRCLQGICFPDSVSTLEPQTLDTLRPQGACYGQYTQQSLRHQGQAIGHANPVLRAQFDNTNRCTNAQAWYWIEAFRYADGASSQPQIEAALRPDPAVMVVYRITALALGMKAGTRVVLQSVFVPYPASQNQ